MPATETPHQNINQPTRAEHRHPVFIAIGDRSGKAASTVVQTILWVTESQKRKKVRAITAMRRTFYFRLLLLTYPMHTHVNPRAHMPLFVCVCIISCKNWSLRASHRQLCLPMPRRTATTSPNSSIAQVGGGFICGFRCMSSCNIYFILSFLS